jgi:hypothetical protein
VPWTKRVTKNSPQVSSSQKVTYEFNDYSLGYNSFISNDKFPLVNGSSNLFRLAQDARITTLGSYDTRKGFDFHSDSVGVTQDQSITSVTGAADKSFSQTTWLAQKFTAGTSGRLTKLDINLKNDASATGTVLISIYSDNGGSPGTLLATSSVPAASITSSYAYLSFRFASAPVLTATSVYWIVANVQAVGSGSYKWSSSTSATTAKTSADSGGTWSAASYALNFKQYYATTGAPKGFYRAYKSDGTKVTLMAHGTTLYSVNDVTGALTSIKTGLSASATTYRFVTVNDIVYYVNGFDGLRKWDFTTESQVNTTNYTIIAVHKGLLFLAGGVDPNAIFFSNFGVYETFTSTDFLYADSPKTGDPVTALISLNGYLLVFTRNNKFILSGSDNATFAIDEAPDQNGTYTQETVTQDDNFVYYLAPTGVYRSNGSEAQLMSKNNYQEVSTMPNKETACVCINRGRFYLWYESAGASANDSCLVWNLKLSSSDDTVESHDTGAYVSRAINGFRDSDNMLVASSLVGQVYWQENSSNDYNNLGEALNFLLQTHYMVFSVRLHYQSVGGPSVLKAIRKWEPRFTAQTGSYTIDCQYASDLRDNWQTYDSPNIQGMGPIWGSSSMVWGSFIWGTTAEVQKQYYVPGEYRRIAIRYKHSGARQPHSFLGHSFVVKDRRQR